VRNSGGGSVTVPGEGRMSVGLATSESTDSHDDEDGSWSSEEMSGDEVCSFFFWILFIEVACYRTYNKPSRSP
jgi:hypothetical protein